MVDDNDEHAGATTDPLEPCCSDTRAILLILLLLLLLILLLSLVLSLSLSLLLLLVLYDLSLQRLDKRVLIAFNNKVYNDIITTITITNTITTTSIISCSR